jgi:glycerol-3-phosphate acyltransferase PlsY
MTDSLLIIAAYLAGSLSSAIITCKLLDLPDPRGQGSGNPGTTNVLRIGGKKAAIITLIGDFLKGFLPVMLAVQLGTHSWVIAATMCAAFAGHLWPLFFSFKGGKGVATGAGCLFGLAWPVGLAAVATWLLIAAATRLSSLAALMTAGAVPFYTHWWLSNSRFTGAAVLISILIIWRHRGNISNLIAGTESRIGGSASSGNQAASNHGVDE